jgi:hypothetical protein
MQMLNPEEGSINVQEMVEYLANLDADIVRERHK